MKYINSGNFLLSILAILIGKTVVMGSINLPESLIGIAIIAYSVYTKHLEHIKAKSIEKSYDDRLKNLESKMSFLDLGQSMSSNNQRPGIRR